MSIFPFLDGNSDNNYELEEELPLYKEIAWDFENNCPLIIDGNFKIIDGNEALKVWVWKALNTERFKHIIYSWDYGHELNTLVGIDNHVDLISSEAERYIEEALLNNPYIISISNLDINSDKDVLVVNVTVNTIYGEMEVSTGV